MRSHPVRAGVVLLLLAMSVGCAKDEGPLFVPKPVDPELPAVTVHFSTVVLPIFTEHCWVCHPPMGNGMDLSAENAYTELVNVTSVNWGPAVRVAPGDPDASVLWHKVNYSPDFGLGMPPSGTALSNAELETIRVWIEQGALNN